MTFGLDLTPYLLNGFAGLVLGVILGSFVTAFSFRLPRGISILTPRSFCPACQKPLAVRDLVPIASWYWSGGKCSHCRTPIPRRYPLIEAICGLLTACALISQPYGTETLLTIFLIVFGMTAVVIDLEGKEQPRVLLFLLLGLTVIHALAMAPHMERYVFYPMAGMAVAALAFLRSGAALPHDQKRLWFGTLFTALPLVWFSSFDLLRFIMLAGTAAIVVEYLRQEERLERRCLPATLVFSWLLIAVT